MNNPVGFNLSVSSHASITDSAGGSFYATSSEGLKGNGTLNLSGAAPSAGTQMKDGQVAFENNDYSIAVSDQGEVNIHNKNTGEKYRIWGDPHVDVDGKRAFDFKGNTTFVLDDGTKVTVHTTPWKGNNNQTIASTVSIIDGSSSYAVKITGVDDNIRGDLAFEEVQQFGHFLDAEMDDGSYVHENPDGKGFIAVGPDGWAEVDQSIMDFRENTLQKWVSGEDIHQMGCQHCSQQTQDLLDGQATNPTMTEFQRILQELLSLGNREETTPFNAFLSILESFVSLAHQQPRAMGHFSGLQEIQNTGTFLPNLEAEPFSFSLRFHRH